MAAWVPFAIMGGLQTMGAAYNIYQARQIKPSAQLNANISALSDVNYYAPMLQRLFNQGQADATMQKNLSRAGQGNNLFLQQELAEANAARSGEQVKQGMQQLEGQRMSLLSNLLGQKQQVMLARRGAQAGAVNDLVSGLGQTGMAYFQMQQQNKAFDQQQAMMEKMGSYQPPSSSPNYGMPSLLSMFPAWGNSIFGNRYSGGNVAPQSAPGAGQRNYGPSAKSFGMGGNESYWEGQ